MGTRANSRYLIVLLVYFCGSLIFPTPTCVSHNKLEVYGTGSSEYRVFEVRGLSIVQCYHFPPPPLSLSPSSSPLPGGEAGSADTARDPRGFSVKMYTEQGNWDCVGNNTPIFFIRDPIHVGFTI